MCADGARFETLEEIQRLAQHNYERGRFKTAERLLRQCLISSQGDRPGAEEVRREVPGLFSLLHTRTARSFSAGVAAEVETANQEWCSQKQEGRKKEKEEKAQKKEKRSGLSSLSQRRRSAVFQRLASPPSWSADFYANSERTGGALVDLHIHDADFIRWCFGEPTEALSSGTLDHLTTLYRFADGPAHVVAEGGWDHTPGFAFKMRYVVVFEEATADFDLGRDPVLLLSRGGEASPVKLPDGDGYVGEVEHLLGVIRAGAGELRCTIPEAADLARLLERERAGLG